jgi:hypothetical protein
MDEDGRTAQHRVPWNKGKLIGQKAPLKLNQIWAIRIRLQLSGRTRDLALFNLGIDSKLRGCDLVALRVCDIAQSGRMASRARNRSRRRARDRRANGGVTGSETVATALCRPSRQARAERGFHLVEDWPRAR